MTGSSHLSPEHSRSAARRRSAHHEWIDEDERRIEQLVPGTFSGHVLGGAADLSFERWPMLAKQR
jgi:hypothetical protein